MSDDNDAGTGATDNTDDDHGEVQPGDDGRFDAEYVGQLRAEAAQRRREAREAQEAAEAANERLRALQGRLVDLTINQAAAGILADPDDLTRYVPADQLVDQDGNPDPAKVKAAAEELVKTRPHLGPRRPVVTGDVGQGAREAGPEPFDLAGLLRRAAG